MTRAAIVGCGDVAVIHLEAIAAIPDIELSAIVEPDAGRRAAAAAAHAVPVFENLDQLIAAGAADVLHITTPHHQHHQPTIRALEAGLHVIQEKPLAHTLEAAAEIVAAAESAHSKVGICFQNRYNASSQAMRALLDSGRLGEIQGAYANVVWTRTADYYRARPWRGRQDQSGGGLLINQAIHTLDLVQWFLGGYDAIAGRVSTDKFGDVIDVEDTAHALITHPSGVTTSFYATLTAPVHRPVEIEIYATFGMARIADGLHVRFNDGTVEHTPERAVPSTGRSYWGVSHELLIRDFYARLADPEPYWISPQEGLTSLRMLKDLYALN